MLAEDRTIVALATSEGRSGVAMVRVSGCDALTVARRLLPTQSLSDPITSHLARLATVRWPQTAGDHAAGEALDEVLVLPMLAPNSYTGENTVEFSCHGGVMPARRIVAACIAAGADAAQAGEFTRRAFLNGRLSLTQAEAVIDLIDSEHEVGARACLAQLRGGLQRRLEEVEKPLRKLLAALEGSLEFAGDEGVEPDDEVTRATLVAALDDLDRLLEFAPAGRLLRDGVQVVLVGDPNAGKSSLFNALLCEDRAIVDTEPGTTRDVVNAPLDIAGLRFVLHDTAGLRDRVGGVEAKGIARTRDLLASADLVLHVHPAGSCQESLPADVAADARVLRVATKGDLVAAVGSLPQAVDVVTSCVTGHGIAELRQTMMAAARDARLEEAASAGVVLNQRHQTRLRAARTGLAELLPAVDAGAEVVASLLAGVLRELGSVSGRVFTEQILGDVFSRFCVGK